MRATQAIIVAVVCMLACTAVDAKKKTVLQEDEWSDKNSQSRTRERQAEKESDAGQLEEA